MTNEECKRYDDMCRPQISDRGDMENFTLTCNGKVMGYHYDPNMAMDAATHLLQAFGQGPEKPIFELNEEHTGLSWRLICYNGQNDFGWTPTNMQPLALEEGDTYELNVNGLPLGSFQDPDDAQIVIHTVLKLIGNQIERGTFEFVLSDPTQEYNSWRWDIRTGRWKNQMAVARLRAPNCI